MHIDQNIHLKPGDQKWIHCNYCNTRTHHQMLSAHRSQTWMYDTVNMDVLDEEFDDDIEHYLEFRLWACLGCDTCLMETIYNEGEPTAPEAQYTPPRQLHGVIPKEFHLLPTQLATIYQQLIYSFNYNLNILCAIGIRALLEGICVDKQSKGKNLLQKIDNLKDHHLPPNIIKHLHNFRFIGNDAAHELEAPNQYTLKQCIEVLEDLMNYLYQLEYKVSRIYRQKNNS
jgi:hypothetical protein